MTANPQPTPEEIAAIRADIETLRERIYDFVGEGTAMVCNLHEAEASPAREVSEAMIGGDAAMPETQGNPNHPVVRQMSTEWHKVVAVLMADYGIDAFEITADMLTAFEQAYPGGAVVADARGGRLVIRLVNGEEAERLARKEGGLPT